MAETTPKTAAKKPVSKPAKAAPAVKKPAAPAVAKPAAKSTATKPASKTTASPQPAVKKAAAKPSASPKKPVKTASKTAAKTAVVVSDEQRYRMVAEAAYYRAESNQFKSDPLRDWIEAESDIAALLSGNK